MEASTDDGTGATAGGEEAKCSEEVKAAEETSTFLSAIEPAELQKCVFPESLVTVSESGGHLGDFRVTVEFSCRLQQPCMLLRAQSQGVIDGHPCGTSVTAYLSAELEVLEEQHHEYIKLEGHNVDKRCRMVQCDGEMVIDKVTTVAEEKTKESMSYPMSVLRGLVTEGSSLLLMRLMAQRKKVPENVTFISLDQKFGISHSTYSELGVKQLEVGEEVLEVFGVQRTVTSVEDSMATWQCYFLNDGHLVSRAQLGSPVTMKLLHLPSKTEREKIPLEWDKDMQTHCDFLDRKEELHADRASYLKEHPEVRALLSDFLAFLLLRKPDDVFQSAREYFRTFASRRPPESNVKVQPS
ncbi:ciliogenesis-associated TTC17-interacting protein [Nematolebias whitei]|uniref:ciliogenesis-associated TTC17-interacting protein n=1 Tax=Nematolebias whitei TaxID=451745 RepID=UPI001896E31C|nr:ciliogenesis-associated TTC17-interacting protein [Nematolebias whitei]